MLACMPALAAPDRTSDLTRLAGIPIQIFDLQAADVSGNFREFLSRVPMTNDRPLPSKLIDDTVASLLFVKSYTAPDEPSYFVASYIQKTPLMASAASKHDRYTRRYGEAVYPQQVCPVFINRAAASPQRMLSTAVNLPARYFDGVNGSAESFDYLFTLTEASHCGFIARELVSRSVVPQALGPSSIRSILEAIGDVEATAVYRSTLPPNAGTDEADVLFAARLLAMFLLERENPYTAVPALLYEYRRIGLIEAHRQMARIAASVHLARRTVRRALRLKGASPRDLSLAEIDAALGSPAMAELLVVDDDLAGTLIAALQPAIRLIVGDLPPPVDSWPVAQQWFTTEEPRALLTLGGIDGP